MFTISDDQYFLVIKKLDFFPEIKTNTIGMLEQVFNALLLQSTDNIQDGINKILELEYSCHSMLDQPYLNVLIKLQPVLEANDILVVQGEDVRGFYPGYNANDCYYWDIGKQTPMNVEFALAKKLSYDGKKIIWEDTYVYWLDQVMMDREQRTAHKPDDGFITHTLFQKVQDLHWKIQSTIIDETKKYVKEYRNQLT